MPTLFSVIAGTASLVSAVVILYLFMRQPIIYPRENSVEPDRQTINILVSHFILRKWSPKPLIINENFDCGKTIKCTWSSADNLEALNKKIHEFHFENNQYSIKKPNFHGASMKHFFITVGLYNIHSVWEKWHKHYPPPSLDIPIVNLTMAESEESYTRFNHLFGPAFKLYDEIATVSPHANVQRVYQDAFLYPSQFLTSTKSNFSSLIKAASYVASNCHRHNNYHHPHHRDNIVQSFRENGFRVDGLGKCLHSIGDDTEDVQKLLTLDSTASPNDLFIKRKMISNYLFYLALENSIEPGYVTEKVFDALYAGIVPIYMGDAHHLKSLLPHPKAVIFISDYNNNVTNLSHYLKYLTSNEIAYEEHRNWRSSYNYTHHIQSKPLLQQSWQCRVCQWAAGKISI